MPTTPGAESGLHIRELAALRDGYARMREFVDRGRWQDAPWAEGTFTQLLVMRLAAASSFVDIGASVGFYSALALRFLPPHGRVLAFEPEPAGAAVLRDGFAGDDRIRVIEAAVGNQRGTITLGWPVSPDYPCATAAHLESSRTFTVETVVLSDVLADLPGPCLIKMDIEGAEALALEGLGDALTRQGPELFFEIHPELIGGIKPGGLKSMEAQFSRAGYRLYNCDHDRLVPTPSLVGSRLYAAPAIVPVDAVSAPVTLLRMRAKRLLRELLKGY